MHKKVILMILDGWGIATNKAVSAIDKANTPFVDSLYTRYQHSKLEASGMAVGLPDGQMGNSEVGHMNLGAGRVVYQDLAKINLAIEDGSIKNNKVLSAAFRKAKEENRKLHFMGLVSDGGVHSHINHLKGLLSAADAQGLKNVFIHAFTDGRDTDPNGGAAYLADLQKHCNASTGKIASVTGRYYAMDRDNRWERIKLAYDAMVRAEGKPTKDLQKAMAQSYEEGITDEFIKPMIHTDADGLPLAKIEPDDVVISFNFRTDRGREISRCLTQEVFPEQNMQPLDITYVTMSRYDDTFKDVQVIFEKDNLKNTIGEVLERHDKKQIRIAETEKYPHVTFFFSGGQESEFNGEKRLLCPSPKVATYDLQPEMSANDIKDKIIPELKNKWPDFVCLNFANPDMVGHTGVFEAAVKACETVDKCAKEVIEVALENDYTTIVIADHGNSDFMINDDGSPNTAHTTNLVPCIMVDNDFDQQIENGKLGNIAPTILALMGIEQPAEMTCESLIK